LYTLSPATLKTLAEAVHMIYPKHLAVIADGNRTRAKNQWQTPMDGHFAWAKNTIDLFKHIFSTTEVKVVTWRFLSTENLKNRSETEIEFIFGIYKIIGNDLDEFFGENHINFKWIGNPDGISDDFREFLENKEKTFSFPDSDRYAVIAINYGGRDEIIRGIKKMAKHEQHIDDITEETLSQYMDLGGLPNVEMVIRTKGDEAQRTSWFMSWWIGYAELYFTPHTYPAFWPKEVDESLIWFDSVADKRNYGK